MSSRLPTSASSRSVSSSIVSRNSLRASARPVDVVLEQARHGRLDRRRAACAGRARRPRGAPSAARSRSERAGRRRPRPRAPPARPRPPARRERLEDALVLAADAARPTSASTWSSPSSTLALADSGASGTRSPAGGVDRASPLAVAVQHARRRRARARAELSRTPAPARRRRAGRAPPPPPARARPRPRAAPRARRSALTVRRDGQEDDEREDVLALADRERVERRREVPVDEQEAATAATSAGQRPPTAETTTTSSRKSSRTLGRPRSSRRLREHAGQQRQGRPRRARADEHAAARQRRAADGAAATPSVSAPARDG